MHHNHTAAIGTFSSRTQAEKAIHALRERGFNEGDVSIIAKGDADGGGHRGAANDSVSDGAAWGAGVAGGATLLAGVGALAIPGIGPLLAAGPIAATLTAAAGGGLAGALVDYGIPAGRTRHVEREIKAGKTVALVKTGDDKARQAADIFRQNGAVEVELD